MNGTQVVITVGYAVAVAIAGVAFAFVLRSTAQRKRGEVDQSELSKREGRYGILVVGFLAVLLAATIVEVPYGKTKGPKNAQEVDVTAQQFAWVVRPSTVKAGTPVRFSLHSRDVQHGFGVYDGFKLVFQVQVPATGGRPQRYVHTFHKRGTYEINCLEFCGFQHHNMRGTLRVE